MCKGSWKKKVQKLERENRCTFKSLLMKDNTKYLLLIRAYKVQPMLGDKAARIGMKEKFISVVILNSLLKRLPFLVKTYICKVPEI